MSLISRHAALNTVQDMYELCDTGDMRDYHDLLTEAFEALPTVDAVEVVRCKDCNRFRPDDDIWGWCTVSAKMRCKDYCSYGVRKDGEQHDG